MVPKPRLDAMSAFAKSPGHMLDGGRGGTRGVEGNGHGQGPRDFTPAMQRKSTTVNSRLSHVPRHSRFRALALPLIAGVLVGALVYFMLLAVVRWNSKT